MIENAFQRYKIFNPKNKNCPVCAGLNNIYKTESFQREMKVPEEVGKGYYRRIIVRPSIELFISDVTFCEDMTMVGKQDTSLYCLAFCLGDALQWRVAGNKKEYQIECGENYIVSGNWGNSVCSYNPGQRFYGLSIELNPEIIKGLFQHLGKEYAAAELALGNTFLYKRKFSSAIKLILNDIINCRYRDDIKRIYLEGKVLELTAVYMDEFIYENEERNISAKFSVSDIASLHQAKEILDENIVSPPTLGMLARLVCLNEYKLKTGFKELFGMPVHAYVIDKRLEAARFLMEEKKLRVTETALLIGYNDASHFAEKFRKKYGVNPSEYVKRI